MATAKQIDSNRKNAEKSTGPKTEEGKAQSRANAFKHGLAGTGPVVESHRGEAFEARRESWAATYRPGDATGAWALDRVVSASFRIEECERAYTDLVADQSERACLAWDLDRRVDVSVVAARLARNPTLVVRQLEATRHGCEWLLMTWERLEAAHEANGGWSDLEASRVLDLLGVPADLRAGRTPLDAPEGVDPLEHRRALILEETERLREFLAESLEPLDDLVRSQTIAGRRTMLSKPAALILRYEREAWSRYRAALRDLHSAPAPEPAAAPPAPERPRPRPEPAAAPPRPPAPAISSLDAMMRTPASGPLDPFPPLSDDGSSYIDIAIGRAPAKTPPR